jgi:hypothetical protein
MITLGPSLMGLRGTQVMGSIIYTLVTLCYLIAVEFIGSHIRSMNQKPSSMGIAGVKPR